MDVENGFGYKFNEDNNGKRSRQATVNRDNPRLDILPRRKRRKVQNRRKTTARPRKNRPYQDITRINLDCCTERTCLLNHERQVFEIIRRDFDKKLYEDQNRYLSSMLETKKCNRRRNILYYIRDASGLRKVQICKTAFMRIFGLGKTRIAVLIKKLQPYSGDVEDDQRRFLRNQKRLPLSLKAEVSLLYSGSVIVDSCLVTLWHKGAKTTGGLCKVGLHYGIVDSG